MFKTIEAQSISAKAVLPQSQSGPKTEEVQEVQEVQEVREMGNTLEDLFTYQIH